MKVVFLLILFIKTEKTTCEVFRNLLRCEYFRQLDYTFWNYMYCKYTLKLVSAIFYQNFIFHQMIAPQKLWKIFISSKKLFSFSRYSNFCIFVFPSFFSCLSHCFRGWFKKNPKVCDVINCLDRNLITHYVFSLEKEKRCNIKT